jgi:hypothetical protein
MTPSEFRSRLAVVEKAVRPAAGDGYIVVDIYGDPEATRLDPDEDEGWPRIDPLRQPTREEYAAYQLAEQERMRRLEALPPTRMRIKRVSPRDNG